ncbi:hypothetical protein V6259_17980 [Marinomonas sp. TI.3.20]|uniref:hypothetical protein n=1 Tax=Marinomonas sp. TI.3.20 TaxID=3121296 RepID=UPI00311EADCC
MQSIKFSIGTEFAIALINADVSGLSDEEEEALDTFSNKVIKEHGHAHFALSDDPQEFGKCAVTGLQSSVTTLILNK